MPGCFLHWNSFGTLRTDETPAVDQMMLLREGQEHRRKAEFDDEDPFLTIISDLSEECCGNVHLKGAAHIKHV